MKRKWSVIDLVGFSLGGVLAGFAAMRFVQVGRDERQLAQLQQQFAAIASAGR